MPVGIPFEASKEAVVAALKKRNGVITEAAKEFGVDRHTLAKRIHQDKDLEDLSLELRCNLVEQRLDCAEDTIAFAIEQRKNDLGNALKASFFMLNNLGKKRGYNHPRSNDSQESSELNEVIDG